MFAKIFRYFVGLISLSAVITAPFYFLAYTLTGHEPINFVLAIFYVALAIFVLTLISMVLTIIIRAYRLASLADHVDPDIVVKFAEHYGDKFTAAALKYPSVLKGVVSKSEHKDYLRKQLNNILEIHFRDLSISAIDIRKNIVASMITGNDYKYRHDLEDMSEDEVRKLALAAVK